MTTTSPRWSGALAVTARPFLDTFKGFRVLDENRLEVYVDFWHFEENYIASYASPSSVSMPWEVLAAMDDLVFEQRRPPTATRPLAVSTCRGSASCRTATPGSSARPCWASSARARCLRVSSCEWQSLVTEDEAQARYQAVLDWFSEHNLMVISNGPFMLTRYDPPAQFAELTANRHPDYPFSKGRLQLWRGRTRSAVRDSVDAAADRRCQHPHGAGRRPWHGRAAVHAL